VEERGVLGPGDDGARRHERRKIAVAKPAPRQIGERHHRADLRATFCVAVFGAACQHDVDFAIVFEVVQRHDDVPAIHLPLIERLCPVIETAGIAEPHRVCGREQPE